MKKFAFLFIILVALMPAFGQNASRPPKGLTAKYDKFKDVTDVWFSQMLINPSITGWISFKGQTVPERVDEFFLTVEGSHCSGYCFNDPTIIFLIDDERVVGPKLSNTLADSVTFILDRELWSRLAAAQKVEFQVGPYETVLKGRRLEPFKTLLNYATTPK